MFSAASKKTSENQAAILTQPRPGTMLIRQGIVVDHLQAQKADILIVDGKIADIAPEIHIIPKQCEIIEAAGIVCDAGRY